MQTLLATQCSLFFNEYQKPIKFIAYIYIRFNQNFDEKSYINAKIEAVNIYTQFSANCGIAPTSTQMVESIDYFDATDVAWLDVVIGM